MLDLNQNDRELDLAIKTVLDSCPISYYTGRKIPMTTTECSTSFYDSNKDTIYISFDIIIQGLTNVNDISNWGYFNAVRSMVYHEVSHALITPSYLSANKLNNIFEDERIETLLNKFYIGVDFKKNLYAINGKPNDVPDTCMQGFYTLVRYRQGGTPEMVNDVQNIINKYKSLKRESTYGKVYSYERDIRHLYQEYKQWFENTYPNKPLGDDDRYNSGNYNPNCNGSSSNGGEETTENNIPNNILDIIEQGVEDMIEETNSMPTDTQDELDDTKDKMGKGCTFNSLRDMVKKSLGEKQLDEELIKCALDCIEAVIRKKNKSKGGNMGYSGRINPKAIAKTEDYRYFKKPVGKNLNDFTDFNLNLFLDNSGSFAPNDSAVNKLLGSLQEVKKRCPNFTYTITTLGNGVHRRDVDNYYHHSCYGSELSPQLKGIFKEVQKKGAFNRNIVLVDGLFLHDNYFSVFDYLNCIAICPYCDSYMFTSNCPNATVFTTDNFSQELRKHIMRAFGMFKGWNS